MQEILKQIEIKNSKIGFEILPPPSQEKIHELENKVGFKLPEDFKEFYSFCNGFECLNYIFNFLSIESILNNNDYGENWFLFSEYLIFSDYWGLKKTSDGKFTFFNSIQEISSNSLIDFLDAFSKGNLFDDDGIYDWIEKLSKKT